MFTGNWVDSFCAVWFSSFFVCAGTGTRVLEDDVLVVRKQATCWEWVGIALVASYCNAIAIPTRVWPYCKT